MDIEDGFDARETGEKLKEFIDQFKNTLLKNLEDDPQHFQPAIEALMKNYHSNSKTPLQLLSLLHSSFKNTIYKPSHPPTTRKGKKISVQPTAIARRHSKYSGKRRFQGGKGKWGKKKPVAPHSLGKCVENNKGLGDRKIAN